MRLAVTLMRVDLPAPFSPMTGSVRLAWLHVEIDAVESQNARIPLRHADQANAQHRRPDLIGYGQGSIST